MDPSIYFQGTTIMFALGLIVMAVSIIIYLIGRLIRNENMITKSKINIMDVMLSVFLFLFLFTVISLLDDFMEDLVIGIDPYASASKNPLVTTYEYTRAPYNLDPKELGVVWDDLTGSENRCLYQKQGSNTIKYPAHVCVTLGYLDSTSRIIEDTMLYILRISGFYSVLSNLKLSLIFISFDAAAGTTGEATVQPLAGFKVDQSIVMKHFNRLTTLYSVVKFQEFFFDLFYQIGFALLLVIGLAFRMFSYTRKFGGFLIAAMLSLYYAAPFGYVIMHRALYETDAFLAIYYIDEDDKYAIYPKLKMFGKNTLEHEMEVHGISEVPLITSGPGFFDNIKNIGKNYKETAMAHLHLLSHYLSLDVNTGNPLVGDDGILHGIARITVLVAVLPIVVLFIILSSIKALGPLFGGESSIGGLVHFI